MTDVGKPFLTWYDDATGERTELSYATFGNWVAKTANLLVDGLGVAPGDTVALALPAHWQTVVVGFAAWHLGASIGDTGAVAAFVHEPLLDSYGRPPGVEVIGLSLLPMARGLAAVRPGVTDYAEEVPAYGDAFAGRLERAMWDSVDLLPSVPPVDPSDRIASALPLDTAEGWVLGPLAAYRGGAGLVLQAAPPDERRLETERVTLVAASTGLVPVSG